MEHQQWWQRSRFLTAFQEGFMAGGGYTRAIDEDRRKFDRDYDAGVKEGKAMRDAARERARKREQS